jgi:polyhydroxyalkanoate synthesis regulator protein
VIAFIERSEKMMDKIVKLFSHDKVNESLIKTWCEDIDYDGKVIGNSMQYFQSLYPSYKGKPSQDQSINKSKKKSV